MKKNSILSYPMGPNSLKSTNFLSQHHPHIYIPLPSPILPYLGQKFMILMEFQILMVQILYCKIFDTFLFINIDRHQNIRFVFNKKTRSFSSIMVHLKGFSPQHG
jgi:hypothetical protein